MERVYSNGKQYPKLHTEDVEKSTSICIADYWYVNGSKIV